MDAAGTVETSLRADLKEMRYIGYYTKHARSKFGRMTVTPAGGPPNPK